MEKSIILDCETLGKGPSAIITEIAAIAFDRATMTEIDCLDLRPAIFQQLRNGRSYDGSTLDFHAREGTLPADLSGNLDCRIVAVRLEAFFLDHEPERVWIQGTCFDRPLIEDFMRGQGRRLPWDFWRSRDARTAWDMAFPGEKHPKRDHRALNDCRDTLRDLGAAVRKLSPLHFSEIV